MQITVVILHRGEKKEVVVNRGETYADAVARIGYPHQGHQHWRLWKNGEEIPFDSVVKDHTTVLMSHEAMGCLA